MGSVSAWEAIFMLLVLKIPVVYLAAVVWWAIRAVPDHGRPGGDAVGVPVPLDPCDWRGRRRRPLPPRPGLRHGRGREPLPLLRRRESRSGGRR